MNLNKSFFKYCVYYPVIFVRGEWLWSHLSWLKKSQFETPDRLREIQLVRLNKLLQHARKTVPFYSSLPETPISSFEQLAEIPLLEKDSLRSYPEQFWSTQTGFMTRNKTTGGSTGAALTIRKDSSGMAQELAATWRGYGWAGIEIGDKQARFWGVPHDKKGQAKAKLIDFVTNRMRLSAFSFSDSDLENYYKKVKKSRPKYFYGYVSMIKQFAEYVEDRGLGGELNIKAVITTSEVLTDSDRSTIENVFNCKVFDEYGCGEIGTVTHECSRGRKHINAENVILEIVDEDGNPVKSGDSGEIVLTDLTNFSMPLIRYRIKDFAKLSDQKCDCGVNLPTLSNIHGREYDMLVNSKGEKFHGEFFLYMVEDLKKKNIPVSAFQLEQLSNRSIIVRLNVKAEDFDEGVKILKDRIWKQFDSAVPLSFELVDSIARESSGKLRVIKRQA